MHFVSMPWTPKGSMWIVKLVQLQFRPAQLPRFEFVTGLIIFANLITVGVELELALSTPDFELLGVAQPGNRTRSFHNKVVN